MNQPIVQVKRVAGAAVLALVLTGCPSSSSGPVEGGGGGGFIRKGFRIVMTEYGLLLSAALA